MVNRSIKYDLCEKWKLFFNLIFDPWLLILLIATFLLVVCSNDSQNQNFLLYINLLITLTSSLLGGFFANKWANLTEKNILEVRAKSAIRSLKLIFTTINNLENRTSIFLSRMKQENDNSALIKSNLEEIIEKCNILEEETINSIEDWTDIIPEVENAKSQIGLITELKVEVLAKETEIVQLKEEIGQNKELQSQLDNKEKELQSIKQKLANEETRISTGLLSGITVNSGSIGLTGLAAALYKTSGYTVNSDITENKKIKLCEQCKKPLIGINSVLCENCSKLGKQN